MATKRKNYKSENSVPSDLNLPIVGRASITSTEQDNGHPYYLPDILAKLSDGSLSANTTSILQYLLQNNQNAAGDTDSTKESYKDFMTYLQELESREYNERQANESRAYDRQLQLDQRSYESESSQLSRLMSLGLSRSAALQLIQSGSAGDNASSVQQSSGNVAGISNSISPSQSDKNKAETTSAQINTIQQIAAMAISGLSIPQQVALNQISTNQALASQLQTQGLQDAGAFGSVLFNSKSKPSSDDLLSLDTLMSWAESQDATINPEMAAFVNSPAYQRLKGNAFAYPSLQALYMGHMDTKRWKQQEIDAQRYSRMLQLQEKVANLSYDQDFLDYEWQEIEFADFKDRHSIINQYTMMEFQDKLDMLAAARTPEQLHFRIEQLKYDNEFKTISSWFDKQKQLYLKGNYTNTSNPAFAHMLNTAYVLNEMGVNGILGDVARLTSFVTGVAEGAYNESTTQLLNSPLFQKMKDFVFPQGTKSDLSQDEQTASYKRLKSIHNLHGFTIFPDEEFVH